MSKLITEVLVNKDIREEAKLNAFAAQLADVGAPWA